MATDGTTRRKLAAILMADAVGYSRLMGEDEADTVRTIKTCREVFTSAIERHEGRVVNAPGDSILAELDSVVHAVSAALEIQRELAERNSELPANRVMAFRIGINLGDVVVEEDAIYGDGVNIAARRESLAEPGGICIARNVHDQVEGKLPLEFEYLGKHPVKTQSVRAYKVVVPVGGEGQAVAAFHRSDGRLLWSAPICDAAASGLPTADLVIDAIGGLLFREMHGLVRVFDAQSTRPILTFP